MDIISKIRLVDNDLVTSIISDKESFEKLSHKMDCLFLDKFNRITIDKFIKENEKGGYILLNCTKKKFNEEDVQKFIDFETDYQNKKIFRIILLNHTNLNINLNFLLEETVVVFSDEKVSLESM